MWEPQRLTLLRASTASCGNSFIFLRCSYILDTANRTTDIAMNRVKNMISSGKNWSPPFLDTTRTAQKKLVQKFLYCCGVFVVAVMFLFTEALPSNNGADWWEYFMNYAIDMGSGAMIRTPSIMKTGLAIQKSMEGDTQTHTDSTMITQAYFFFFQNEESRLNIFFFCFDKQKPCRKILNHNLHIFI
jgi:hypothetical protein